MLDFVEIVHILYIKKGEACKEMWEMPDSNPGP